LRSSQLNAPVRSLLLLTVGLLLISVSALPALGQAAAELDEIQKRIDANGWSFTVKDDFISQVSQEERANLKGFNPPPGYQEELDKHLKIYPIDKDALPSSLDWRDSGGITPIKNQGSCGSCWAFAATAELEAFIKIKYGIETDLSEQQSVSCNPYGAGCDGGWATASYYVFSNYGAVLENCSPYLQADPPVAPCTQDDFLKYGTITGYNHISNDVDQIKAALQYGPVCTAIDAGPEFEAYGGGCYDVPGYGTNHLVLIVGYDDRLCGGTGAWIIKNSWGTDFGEGGYINVAYGAGNTGISVTQLIYEEPPVSIVLDTALETEPLYGDQVFDLNWSTYGDPVNTVDIWLGVDGDCHDILVAENVPNTGTYSWMVPNLGTSYGSLVVFPSSGSLDGFDYNDAPLKIIGHKTRYVSSAGSNTPPYETPATAAHTIGDAVTACTGTDTVLVAGGDYYGGVSVNTTVKIRGSWDTDFTVQDLDAHPTRLQAGGSALRFSDGAGDFGSVEAIVFRGCSGGNASEPVNGQHGGAIFSVGASPTIRDCVFEDNRAAAGIGTGFGGAICVIGGAPVVEDCVFTDNVASSGGAVGVFGGATVTFNDCVFEGNDCSMTVEGNRGGAFFVDGAAVVLNGGRLAGGATAHQGGALALNEGTARLDGVVVEDNQAVGGGGAVYASGGGLELNGTILRNNASGGSGGAVESTGTTVAFRNTRFTANTAANIGGAVCAFDAAGVVENCQVDGNTGPSVGGLFLMGGGALQVMNNLVTGNDTGGLLASGTDLDQDYNNVWNNAGGDDMSGVPGPCDLSLDPLFVDASAGDFGLALHSPCIDHGAPDPLCLDPDGSRADIGLLGGPGADFRAPARVVGLEMEDLGGNTCRLTWAPNTEPDIQGYVIYRDTTEVFMPDPAKALGSVTHPVTTWDDQPPAGQWYYLVAAFDADGYGGGYSDRVTVSGGVSDVPDGLPRVMAISGIAPNPFNPRTTIRYDVARSGLVRLGVYDVRGHLIRDLVSDRMTAGRHETVWDGRDRSGRAAAAGIYFVRLTSGNESLTQKMVLAK
jgi:C1A family cysteine protease